MTASESAWLTIVSRGRPAPQSTRLPGRMSEIDLRERDGGGVPVPTGATSGAA